jgi:hypothetical protein
MDRASIVANVEEGINEPCLGVLSTLPISQPPGLVFVR